MMRSSLAAISRRRMPSTEPLRKMFSRPVNSGWKPDPTSISAARRPSSVIVPSVGAVMRESSLSNVLLPAPLWPMMPERLTASDVEADVADRPEFVCRRGPSAAGISSRPDRR